MLGTNSKGVFRYISNIKIYNIPTLMVVVIIIYCCVFFFRGLELTSLIIWILGWIDTGTHELPQSSILNT